MLNVQQFLTQNGMTSMPHPPYSPDPSLSDFYLFPWMKKVLKEKCFADVEEVKQKPAALTGVAQWIKCQPANQRVASSIPSLGHMFGLQARSPVGGGV